MAMATGGRPGPADRAPYAATLRQGQLRALRLRADGRTGRMRCPKKTVLRTVRNAVDGQVLERLLLRWQEQLRGPVQDRVGSVEGKQLRPGGVEMVHAVSGAGRFLGGIITADKSHEIPAARAVLRPLDLVWARPACARPCTRTWSRPNRSATSRAAIT